MREYSPSAKDTNHSSNLVVSANDRVDLFLLCKRRQIHSVLPQRVESLLGRLRLHTSVAPSLLDSGLQSRFGEVGLLQGALNGRIFEEREKKVLGDVGVVHCSPEQLGFPQNLESGSAEAVIIGGRALLGYPYNELLDSSPYESLQVEVSKMFKHR